MTIRLVLMVTLLALLGGCQGRQKAPEVPPREMALALAAQALTAADATLAAAIESWAEPTDSQIELAERAVDSLLAARPLLELLEKDPDDESAWWAWLTLMAEVERSGFLDSDTVAILGTIRKVLE